MPCPYQSVGKAYRLCNKNGWQPADLSRCISKSNPAAIIGSNATSPDLSAVELANMQAKDFRIISCTESASTSPKDHSHLQKNFIKTYKVWKSLTKAEFLEPNHTIFGGDIASSIMMMDTLIKLQSAEFGDLTVSFLVFYLSRNSNS